MSDEHVVGVTQSITAGQWTVGQLLFADLPGEAGAIDGALLLSLSSDGAAPSAAVRCVFTRNVALAIAANHRTPSVGGWGPFSTTVYLFIPYTF